MPPSVFGREDRHMSDLPVLDKVLRQDRIILLGVLAGLTLISWLYLIDMAGDMASDMGGGMAGGMVSAMSMPMSAAWSPTDAVLMFSMWWIMMIGMMVPSAAPMILMFATINRRKREREQPFVPTMIFVAGYLVAWGGFSLAATGVQWSLQKVSLMSPMMVSTSPILGGSLFIVAGLYQWTPLKHACLKNCRSPLDFILNGWRDGRGGAFNMGAEHGLYCLGCCWLVMAILFAVGVMNLAWVGAIAAFVFVEKLVPAGEWFARLSGGVMIAVGAYLLRAA